MWKDKGRKTYLTSSVRPYHGKIFANVPQAVLVHLGVKENSQLIFKLRSNKTVSVGLLRNAKERLVAYRPSKRGKQFPSLAAFYSQPR